MTPGKPIGEKPLREKGKRSSDEIKIDVLTTLTDGKTYSFSMLSRQLKTAWSTIVNNSDFLDSLGFVVVNKTTREESATGRPNYFVKITDNGREWLKGMKNTHLYKSQKGRK